MKIIMKYFAVFCAAAALMASLLVLSALIPRGAIEPQMRESAALLKESELFGTAVDGAEGSRIDRYADSILLNIAWNYDAKEPLRSVMLSEYYYTAYQNENDNLYDAVADGAEANRQYLRYWHGSIALLRPLLTVLTLRQIYVLHGVLLAALAAALLTLRVWEKAWGCAAGVLAGLCAAAGTALCLTMRTFSSPSVTSSSATPDSCTRSMSFLSLRKSMLFSPVRAFSRRNLPSLPHFGDIFQYERSCNEE